MTLEFLAAALAYAERGWHVFPLVEGGKTPDGRLVPRGQNQATTDPQQIRQWWGPNRKANIGIACEPSGLVVVDLDRKLGAADGVAAWETMAGDTEFLETYSVTTPTGNGKHLYFSAPDGEKVKNSAGKLAPGIDIRGNGYVVAAKSIIDGVQYAHNGVLEVQPLPVWVTERLAKPPVSARVTLPAPVAPATPQGDVQARLQALADELAAASEGTGNDTAARIAFMAGQYVGAGQLTEQEAISVLHGAVAGWSHRDLSTQSSLHTTITKQVQEGALTPREWEAPRGRNVPLEALLFPEGAPATPPGAVEVMADDGTVLSPFSDEGQAEQFMQTAARVDGQLIIGTLPGGGWTMWDGKVWTENDPKGLKVSLLVTRWTRQQQAAAEKWCVKQEAAISAAAETIAPMGADADQTISDIGELKKRVKAVRNGWERRLSNGALKAVLARLEVLVSAHPPIGGLEDPDTLNTPAGLVCLKTGTVSPHAPNHFARKVTPVGYVAGAEHADVAAMLSAVSKSEMPTMRSMLGQAITGHSSSKLALMLGNGANGKSMFMGAVLAAMGGYGAVISHAVLDSRNSNPTELCSFEGVRFAFMEELAHGGKLSPQILKRLGADGGGVMTARRLYQAEHSFKMTHQMVVNTNYLPQISANDHGTKRRLAVFEFRKTFAEQTGQPGSSLTQADTGLAERLREQPQQEAILAFLIEAAMEWYKGGKSGFVTDTRAQREWFEESDAMAGFLADGPIEAAPGFCVRTVDFLAAFNEYRRAQGSNPWNIKSVAAAWRTDSTRGAWGERANSGTGLSRPRVDGYGGVPEPLPPQVRVVWGVRFVGDVQATPAAPEPMAAPEPGPQPEPVPEPVLPFEETAPAPAAPAPVAGLYLGGMSTPTQLRKIHHAFDFADPADIVAGCSNIIGREITEGREMNYAEAALVLATYAEACKAAG